ncbi:MAG: FecR domain-containing protein [Hyphomicrobium sp.]|jgi:hypothetical protein
MVSKAAAVISSFMLVSVGATSASASTGQPIGSAVNVVQLVTAQLASDTRNILVGDRVRQDEVIEVSQTGSGELKLDDETKLALGAGAKLTLDKFVYDPGKSGGSIALNFAKGAFRFVTGIAAKSAYVVHVPSASITVRGTIFDVFVEDSGTSWLLLHEGGVQICNARGVCRNHSEPGKFIRIGDDGNFSKPARWASLEDRSKITLETAFPFVVTPPSIDPTPIFTREALLTPKTEPTEPSYQKKPRQRQTKTETDKPQKTGSLSQPSRKTQAQDAYDTYGRGNAQRVSTKLPKTDPAKDRSSKQSDRLLDKAERYAPKTVERVRKHDYKPSVTDGDNRVKLGYWKQIAKDYYKF